MENLCRTCFAESKDLCELFANEELLNKIESFSSIQIHYYNDDLPSKICKNCVEKIDSFIDFKNQIIKYDSKIKNEFENESYKKLKIKEEFDTENLKNLKVYIKAEPEEIKEDFVPTCLICDRVFTSQKRYKNHCEIFHQEDTKLKKQYTCEDCNITFDNYQKFNKHRRTHTQGICNICGAVLRQDNLGKHMQTHNTDPIKCKVCDSVLKNKESLRGHMLLHKDDVYTCDICGRELKVKSQFKIHYRLHTDPGAKKNMCTICGKTVRDLRKHTLSHTGEKPYKCLVCHKGLKSPYALKVHARQHSKEKPFICEYCSTCFSQKSSLAGHINTKHSNNSLNKS